MKTWIASFLSLIFLISTPFQAFALQKELTIPAYINVPIRLKYPVFGNSIRSGDLISIAIAADVYIDKVLVFKQGGNGVLFVERSKHTGAFGRGGAIDIRSGSIKDVTGHEHVIQLAQYSKGNNNASGIILPLVSLALALSLFCL